MPLPETKALAPAPRAAASFFAPIQREIDRVFADFGEFNLPDVFGPTPRMDVAETDQGVELSLELPGLSADDVKIAVEDGVMTISGEKKSETDEKAKGYRVVERRYGSFSRSLRLPQGVEADKVKASLKNGVLRIEAPKAPGAVGRQVTVPVHAG